MSPIYTTYTDALRALRPDQLVLPLAPSGFALVSVKPVAPSNVVRFAPLVRAPSQLAAA